MTPKQLRRKIAQLDADLPAHRALEHALREGVGYGAWYGTQKEHWLGWLAQYDGPGAYNRQTGHKRTAAYVYNHIQCAPMLLWLAEALELPKEQIEAATAAVLAAPHRNASQCAALRRIVTWRHLAGPLDSVRSPLERLVARIRGAR